ncbi:MAG: hypothetical protein LC775_01945 [Acidobacteria bacterium]|nr:hypothetical protein [Acidobacteriota bacterium]
MTQPYTVRRQSEAVRGPQRGSPAGVEDDGALVIANVEESQSKSGVALVLATALQRLNARIGLND